jgi:hypothetical protein
MILEVALQGVDVVSKQGYLHLGRSGIAFLELIFFYDLCFRCGC